MTDQTEDLPCKIVQELGTYLVEVNFPVGTRLKATEVEKLSVRLWELAQRVPSLQHQEDLRKKQEADVHRQALRRRR